MKRLAVLSLILLPLALLAGDGDAHRTRNKKFLIPIELGADRKAVKEARLFVSRDKGKTWDKAQVVSPDEANFVYEADDTGLYWFALQLAYKDGRVSPDMKDFKADLKVLIDPKFVPPEKTVAELEKEIAATRKKLLELEKQLALLKKGKTSGDLDELQGLWRVDIMKIEGEEVPEKDAQEITIEIKGNRLVMKGGPAIGTREFTFTLKPDADPKAIDLTAVAGPAKGVAVPGIYDVLEDKMLLVLPNKETKVRPARFDAPKGSDLGVFLLKREKVKGKPIDLE